MKLSISVLAPTTFSKRNSIALRQAVKKTIALVPPKKLSFAKFDQTPWELSICVVSNSKMKNLNARYRKKNKVTDVLSFSHLEGSWPNLFFHSLGEIVICLPVAKQQARHYKQPLLRELERLVVHGMLHLLGYDHELGKRQEREMFRLQDRILQSISPNHLKT